ncbi:hypothetical protein O1L55_04720 [Streptomyces albulus]|nr:hypothetical protein [Streptomyces noursei]
MPVAVYLDGYRWHASEAVNRIAGDAAKRARLRADGMLVWQITWDDVIAWEKELRERSGRAGGADADEAAGALAPRWPDRRRGCLASVPGGRGRHAGRQGACWWAQQRQDPACFGPAVRRCDPRAVGVPGSIWTRAGGSERRTKTRLSVSR